MKKGITRLVSAISAAAMLVSASSVFATVTTASAANVPVLDLAANGDYYVPASLVENGDVNVRLKVYVDSSAGEAYQASKVKFVSDSDVGFVESQDGLGKVSRNIVFKNLSSQSDKAKTSVMKTRSGIEYEMSYAMPFCFGSIDKNRQGNYVYGLKNGMITTNRYAEAKGVDDIGNKDIGNIGSHSFMMSDGNGGVYFTLSERESAGSAIVKKTLSTADGSIEMYKLKSGGVRFRYNYIDQTTFNKKVGSVEYPYFDESLAKDQPITGDSDIWLWTNGSNSMNVLGEKNEFSLCEVDAVVKRGTEKGDYTISLDPNETSLTAVVNGKNVVRSLADGTLASTKATIHVVDDIKVTDNSINKKLYYYSDSTDRVTTKDVVNYIKADVVTNGQKQNIDITPAIEGVNQPVSGAFISGSDYTTISLALTYSGYNLYDSDGDMLKTDIYIGQKGDANLDGKVDSKDAVVILKYYASALANGKSAKISSDPALEDFSYYLADVNGGSKDHGASGSAVDSKDAVLVLKYYAAKLVNSNATWKDVQ